ncbi:MAG: glycosyltransferase [Gemmatimonadaceae bacterium]|nr:glycosyltransferase [Gemmatimonadaceae bacterium]
MPALSDFLPALPWVALPMIGAWQARRQRSLDDVVPLPAGHPRTSIIIPARNEAHNIGRCVRTVLATEYPDLEVIVVDDHSTDETAVRAREAADGDSRLRVIMNDALPDGWFGKQWACTTGARHATGELLLFADADTAHAPDLLPRLVAAQQAMDADLLSVAGRQELGSFWERLVQPQIFSLFFLRFGGTEGVNNARRPSDVIANGQCLMVRRSAYDAIGGHAAVRHTVVDDLMLAQVMHAAGHRVRLVLGTQQLSTRMYTSLKELVAGWGKNVYAGGIDAMPFGALGRVLFPLLFLGTPLLVIAPLVVLVLGLLGSALGSLVPAAALATGAQLVWMVAVYRRMGEPVGYALLFPLGAVVLGYIFVTAMLRGRRVAWKGRSYVSGVSRRL